MNKALQLLEESFIDSKTNEEVIGVTIVIDGDVKKIFDKIIEKKTHYSGYIDLIIDALIKGESRNE
ncbi:hypothetical protein PJ311_16185 [Bacillus sp. CLL-7-23]|uniref:Uncharacterized protein n=1 Tax=Bacillus changyiensis TaxID=3004103 RepID=A0ABT4X749_9BACI|nr:hypothetical protein [Bacillus changyiensis]MDA7028114.1 hypothetical protein [Bacillus changyiensis]